MEKTCLFFFELETSEEFCHILIPYNTKTVEGYIAGEDVCWEHMSGDNYKEYEWLYIVLNDSNRELVLNGLKNLHIPCEIINDKAYVYGYRTDVDYLK